MARPCFKGADSDGVPLGMSSLIIETQTVSPGSARFFVPVAPDSRSAWPPGPTLTSPLGTSPLAKAPRPWGGITTRWTSWPCLPPAAYWRPAVETEPLVYSDPYPRGKETATRWPRTRPGDLPVPGLQAQYAEYREARSWVGSAKSVALFWDPTTGKQLRQIRGGPGAGRTYLCTSGRPAENPRPRPAGRSRFGAEHLVEICRREAA